MSNNEISKQNLVLQLLVRKIVYFRFSGDLKDIDFLKRKHILQKIFLVLL